MVRDCLPLWLSPHCCHEDLPLYLLQSVLCFDASHFPNVFSAVGSVRGMEFLCSQHSLPSRASCRFSSPPSDLFARSPVLRCEGSAFLRFGFCGLLPLSCCCSGRAPTKGGSFFIILTTPQCAPVVLSPPHADQGIMLLLFAHLRSVADSLERVYDR